MGNSIPTLKLTYFDIQGVAEKVRLALVLQEIPFEDERIGFAQWGELKATTKFGQLPQLTMTQENGTTQTIAQSDAMLRYVARLKSKTLYPEEPKKLLLLEEVLGVCGDLAKAWNPALYAGMRPEVYGYPEGHQKTEEGKKLTEKLRTEFVTNKLPSFLGYFSDYLGEGKFLCGEEVTIADLSLLPALARFSSGDLDFVAATSMDGFPKIAAWMERMRALPKIKAWYAPKEVVEEKTEEKKAPRILMVLTSNDKLGETGEQTGWYLPEVAHPHAVFTAAGCQLTYASIKGGEAPLDIGSIAASPDEESQAFFKDEALMKLTKETLPIADCKAEDYDCIFYAGGFGVMWDFPGCQAASKLAGEIYDNGGLVTAVCHGPAALVNVVLKDGSLLIKGKEVTAFTNLEEDAVKRREVVPWTCEDKLGELGATFVDGGVFKESVVVSDRLLTGQNPPSAGPLAHAIVKALAEKN